MSLGRNNGLIECVNIYPGAIYTYYIPVCNYFPKPKSREFPSNTYEHVFWSVCVQPTQKMKFRTCHVISDRGTRGPRNKKRWLMTQHEPHALKWTNDRRTQLQPKIRIIRTPGHVRPGTIPFGNTASCWGNKRWPQQASTAKPRGAATRPADFTAVPPLLPMIHVAVCCQLKLYE